MNSVFFWHFSKCLQNAILHIAAQRATSTNIQLTLKESRLYINSIDVRITINASFLFYCCYPLSCETGKDPAGSVFI